MLVLLEHVPFPKIHGLLVSAIEPLYCRPPPGLGRSDGNYGELRFSLP
jgi:hypothetical protein